MGIFHHDDGCVHHYAYGNGNAGEAHNVGSDLQVIHADEGHDNGDGQGEDNHEGAGQVKEKDDADNTHRNGQLDDLVLEGADGAMDEIGPVIGGDDLHALRAAMARYLWRSLP